MPRYNKNPPSNSNALTSRVMDPNANRGTTQPGNKPPTLEQRRAQYAWEVSEEGIKSFSKDYVNDAKSAPALIMNSGLMQVLAYLEGKDERHKMLASHLRGWLHETLGLPTDFVQCMNRLLEMNPRDYQAMTAEALAWLKWLRRMAEARKGADATHESSVATNGSR